MISLRSTSLSAAWFDRDQYRPRVDTDAGSRWFLSAGKVPVASDIASLEPPQRPTLTAQVDARDIHAAFSATYADWNLPLHETSRSQLEALRDDRTVCVVTGQQPGFLGGPLYTIYKALGAIAISSRFEAETGTRCVPVFWVAGEDHDIDEVRSVRFPSAGEELVFRLPHAAGRRPISSLEVDSESEIVLDAVAAHLSGRRHEDLAHRLINSYRGRNLASGCATMLAEILGPRGLVFIDPEQLRPLAAPIFKRCIESPDELQAAVDEGYRIVEENGLQPQVAPRLPLFLVQDGERHHLRAEGSDLYIDGGGARLDPSDLRTRLETSPRSFSSGALLRPLIQDALLPSVLTVGGAAEVAYFAQLGPIARWLGMRTPSISLRFGASLIDGRAARAWDRLQPEFSALEAARGASGLLRLENEPEILRSSRKLLEAGKDVSSALGRAELDDATKKRIARGTFRAVSSASNLVDRIEKELKQQDQARLADAEAIWNQLFPEGVLQERRWNVLHYLSRHGEDWIDAISKEVYRDPFDIAHRWLLLEAATETSTATESAATGAAATDEGRIDAETMDAETMDAETMDAETMDAETNDAEPRRGES